MGMQQVLNDITKGKTPEAELQDIHHELLFGVGGLLRMIRDSARYSHDLTQTAADIAEVSDQYISIVKNLSLRLEAAISEVERKRELPEALDKIVLGMAAMAPEVDAMDQGDKIKAFELFGSMVDAAISEQAKA